MADILLKGVSDSPRKGSTRGYKNKIILTTPSFTMASGTTAALEATYIDGIVSGDIFPIQGVRTMENTTEEDLYWTGGRGDKIFLASSKKSYVFRMNYNMDAHKALENYSRQSWRVIFGDDSNQLELTQDGTAFRGLKVAQMTVTKQEDPTESDPTWTKIEIELADYTEWDLKGYVLKPDFTTSELYGVAFTNPTASTITTNVFTVTVVDTDEGQLNSDGSYISDVISGLTIDNFEVIDQTGAIITPDTVVEATSTGIYTVTCTTDGITSGSVQIKASTTNLYNSDVVTLS